jgi:RimJ/RimL family protein N-acetyltransferase
MVTGPSSFHLVMRPPDRTDVDWITEACQDPDIQRWTRVPIPYGRGDAETFIETWAGSLQTWAVIEVDPDASPASGLARGRGSGLARGLAMASIHRIEHGDAALGYWVAPWARRRGVATWATREMVTRAAGIDGVVSASLDIANDNPASQGVARAAGFVPGVTPPGLTVPDGPGQSPATRFTVQLEGPPSIS